MAIVATQHPPAYAVSAGRDPGPRFEAKRAFGHPGFSSVAMRTPHGGTACRKELNMDAALKSSDPTLHVFEQEGEWHWGITIDRPTGIGMKVVAFSEEGFGSEAEA